MKKNEKIPAHFYCSGPEQRAEEFRRQRWLYGTPSRSIRRAQARSLIRKLHRLFEHFLESGAARPGSPQVIAARGTDLRVKASGRLYEGKMEVRSSGCYYLEVRYEKSAIYVFRCPGYMGSADGALVLDRRLPQCSRSFGTNGGDDFLAGDPVILHLLAQLQAA